VREKIGTGRRGSRVPGDHHLYLRRIASTTTTVAATTTTVASTTAARVFFARAGFVDGQGATVVLLPVKRVNGVVGIGVVIHFDEPETFASTGFAVVHDLGGQNLAVRAEQ